MAIMANGRVRSDCAVIELSIFALEKSTVSYIKPVCPILHPFLCLVAVNILKFVKLAS